VERQVTWSAAMAALAPRKPRRLDPGLRALVDEGFELVAEHVILARHAPLAPPWRRSIFNDVAYYEGSVNHVHVQQELVSWRGRGNPLGHALAYAEAVGRALAVAHPARGFDVWAIVTYDDTVVRFHERRDGEHGWGPALADDVPWLGVHVG